MNLSTHILVGFYATKRISPLYSISISVAPQVCVVVHENEKINVAKHIIVRSNV